jgi:hypothetical protein
LFGGAFVWQHRLTLMRNLLRLLVLVPFCFASARAAISVGASGSGEISFGILPPADEWATRSIAGSELAFLNAGDLNAAVQTNSAALITTAMVDALGALPPGQNALASWTSSGTGALWTRPAANGATLLLATLQNNSGADQPVLQISYTLGQSGATPAEQAPGHEVYYSFSGAPGSWVSIAALSGGVTGFKSNIVALTGTWSSSAPLYVLWADDNTPGGIDRGYSIDNISFAGKPPPTLEAVPDFIADVLRPVFFTVHAGNAAPGTRLTYSLDPGAPSTARIHPTSGVFRWVPARSDAGTTNLITVRVTDEDAPALTATRTFAVLVKEYIELSVGSAVMEVGQQTNVSVTVVATVPLTSLTFTVEFPAPRRTDIDVSPSPSVSLLSFQSQPERVALAFAPAPPEEFLIATQELGQLNFTTALLQNSAFVHLRIGNVVIQSVDPGPGPTVLLNHGRVTIINGQPLVDASLSGATRALTLYGRPGSSYWVECATNVFSQWDAWRFYTMSNLVESFDASDTTNHPVILFRARDAGPAPANPLPQASPQTAKSAPVSLISKAKKKKSAAALRLLKKLRNRTTTAPGVPDR